MADASSLDLLDREDLVKLVTTMMSGGVVLNFHGKRSAMEIAKRVRPRCTRRISELHVGSPEEQARNMLIEGENLQAMVTLYKFRGQFDLIVADPPYNTGQHFRYNDRWDTEPIGTPACARFGIRVRGLYCTKDTFCSLAITRGVNPAWLEQQTGVAWATLKRHYAKYIPEQVGTSSK